MNFVSVGEPSHGINWVCVLLAHVELTYIYLSPDWCGSVGLDIVPQSERLPVQFEVRARV